MSPRGAGVLAWTSCGLTVALLAFGWAMIPLVDEVTPTFDAASGSVLVVMPVVGALVASRRPGNSIGWLFCGAGLLLSLAGATYSYAAYALAVDTDLPGGVAAAWLTSWVFLPAVFGVPPLLFLLFPNGRPRSGRWRWAVVLTVVGLTCQGLGAALAPGPLVDSPVSGIENPLGVNSGVVVVLETAGWTLMLTAVLLGASSLRLRYRDARGDERLQLRWLVFSAVLFAAAWLVSAALFQTRFAGVGQALVIVAFLSIPVAAGIAILRHRLYDIDVVINRTLVYGALTAILAGVYLGSVLVLQILLSPLTEASDLAVAASTLAVAAVFGPARRRIQAAVDRRFYRRRYDAGVTLASFVGRLRQEVDLEAVSADLRGVVRETVQPAHVTLWLRRERS